MLSNGTNGSRWRGRYERQFYWSASKNAPCGALFNFLQTLKKLLASALLIAHEGQAMGAVADDFVAGVGVAR